MEGKLVRIVVEPKPGANDLREAEEKVRRERAAAALKQAFGQTDWSQVDFTFAGSADKRVLYAGDKDAMLPSILAAGALEAVTEERDVSGYYRYSFSYSYDKN